ncbi:hepatic lectin-like [Symphorus nematophorus]
MTDYHYEKEPDNIPLWIKDVPSIALSGIARFKSWLFPILTATVILILIIALGVSNTKLSNRLTAMEQSVSNMSDVIQSLQNESLQHAHAKEVRWLLSTVDNNRDQLATVAEALKQLSAVDSLSRSIASLKCSLEHIINNRSAGAGCCPLGWEQFEFNCYFFSRSSLSWNESQAWCDEQGAHLVILLHDKEWDFVTRRTRPEFFWVGLSDWRTGRWEWINQSPYNMERRRWVPGQPDNWVYHGMGTEDCAHLHSSGRLNDLHCPHKLRYICQKHSLRA